MAMQDTQTLWDHERASEVRERSCAPPPQLIDGRYHVVDHLGAGAMGVVFRAEDTVLNRTVALKVLSPARHDDAVFARFRKEACALAQVRHENVVRIYSLGQHRGAPYFAMEYIDGRDLGSIIREHAARRETVPVERALRILRDVAAGLDAVHAHSLVHRDVKPSNIVVEKRAGRPVLIDFGLARRRSASSPRVSTIGGTPSYMAPEQATDATGTRVSARSDLYSLACTAFELLTGRGPFDGETALTILLAHTRRPAPRISSVRPSLARFDEVFERALAKTPEDRQATCAAFVAELEEAWRVESNTLPTSSWPPAADRIRVLVLASGDHVRDQIEPALGRALRPFGSVVQVERVARGVDLVRAFARSRADIVVVDDDVAGAQADAVVEGLRHGPGGRTAEVLVLGGNRSAARLDELGVRELPKPLNPHVLCVALGRMGSRIAERRGQRSH
jgi:serine/threonine-protein kinase